MRFQRIASQIKADSDSGLDADLEAGRAVLATIEPSDLRACAFHNAHWKAIAEESVRIIEALGRRDSEDYVAEAERSRLGKSDRRWLLSLFADPIITGAGSYTNGQHRGCALRFSGAARATVVTGEELLGEG